jgi:hypothetical protein
MTATKTASAKTASAKKAADRSMPECGMSAARAAFIKYLQQRKAINEGRAVAQSEAAAKLGYTSYAVYCLGYHKFALAAQGFVVGCRPEGSSETHYYLTPAGAKTKSDPCAKIKAE